MYDEDDYIQLSALQHFLFCERQCALIHIEQAWDENVLTAEGRIIHDRAHDGKTEKTAVGVRVERGIRLFSRRLGLVGMADVIEFHKTDTGWQPFPVEYKHGRPKQNDCDRVQICAQALCLEEILGVAIPAGALFYGKTRRRESVAFDDRLRAVTEDSAKRLHEFLSAAKTPKPVYATKCESCSLSGLCMPEVMGGSVTVGDYIKRITGEV